MDQLQGMRVFVRVVEANSFTVAAKHLGMSAAAVARNLNKLEAHLNVRLLVRTTRSLSLTAAGERYVEDCRAMIQMLDNVEARLNRNTQSQRGTLRVGVSAAVAASHVCGLLAAYRETRALIDFDVRTFESPDDLNADQFDIVIAHTRYRPRLSLIGRTLQAFDEVLTASPAYLKRHGTPVTPVQLASHALLFVADGGQRTWELTDGVDIVRVPVMRSVLRLPSYLSTHSAALQDMGVALLPIEMIRDDLVHGRLVHILPLFAPHMKIASGMSVYYSGRTRLPVRVRDFIDFSVNFFRPGVQADMSHQSRLAPQATTSPRMVVSDMSRTSTSDSATTLTD